MVSHYPIRRGSERTLLAAAAAASTSPHLTSNEHNFYPAALCLQHTTHWAGFERCFFLQSAYEQASDRSPLLRLVLLRDRTQLNGRHSLLSDSPHRFLPTVHSLSCHCFTQKLIRCLFFRLCHSLSTGHLQALCILLCESGFRLLRFRRLTEDGSLAGFLLLFLVTTLIMNDGMRMMKRERYICF